MWDLSPCAFSLVNISVVQSNNSERVGLAMCLRLILILGDPIGWSESHGYVDDYVIDS